MKKVLMVLLIVLSILCSACTAPVSSIEPTPSIEPLASVEPTPSIEPLASVEPSPSIAPTSYIDYNCEECKAMIVGEWHTPEGYATYPGIDDIRKIIINEDGTCNIKGKADTWSTYCFGRIHTIRFEEAGKSIVLPKTDKFEYDDIDYYNSKHYSFVKINSYNWSKYFPTDFNEAFDISYKVEDVVLSNTDLGTTSSTKVIAQAKLKDTEKYPFFSGYWCSFNRKPCIMRATIDWNTYEITNVEYVADVESASYDYVYDLVIGSNWAVFSGISGDSTADNVKISEYTVLPDDLNKTTIEFVSSVPSDITYMSGWLFYELEN
ncbi:MAG: hypothetical protein E7312_04705 [Clostridiales bacterium]|nr:hypothetical protein [Clostridiales bacterium]